MNLVAEHTVAREGLVSHDRLSRHESLFKTYYKPLVVYAMRLTNDKAEAEDVVQDVFERLWQQGSTDHIDMVSYLFTAVRNECFKKARHLKVVRKHQAHEKSRTEAVSHDPQHYIQLQEVEKCLSKTLRGLPTRTKEIFLMSRAEQKKNKEIAEVLQVSIKTVESHMSKALALLRKELKPYLTVMLLILNQVQ